VKLIVGLGNPGKSYAAHRHNVGFGVIDLMADRLGIEVKQRSFGALTGKGELERERIILAKPQTFMNLSGDAACPLLRYYKLPDEELIVIHDDIDIELGRLKIARGAGHGGHNGVRSIVEALGDNDFYRVRMGIGRPTGKMDAADYVLRAFDEDETATAEKMIINAADAVGVLITEGLEAAQQRYH